jgi:ABC-type nitrate/sulfonate/bicarbonate transport system ATPase subunit
MSALCIENVGLTLGGAPVLDDVSLHVAEGEFVSILGPSGSGKSSLFRLLTGALVAGSGSIRVNGAPLSGGSRAFAFMPQRDALMPWRRIIDNVTLGLEVQGGRGDRKRMHAGSPEIALAFPTAEPSRLGDFRSRRGKAIGHRLRLRDLGAVGSCPGAPAHR